MVNSARILDAHSLEKQRSQSRSATTVFTFLKKEFDGTNPPIVVYRFGNTIGCALVPFPSRLRSPMRSFWAVLMTVGDKIELTVTIVTREHNQHGR